MSVIKIHDKHFKPFISEEKILSSIQNVANRMNKDYQRKEPLFICVLNGSFLFAADLLRNIEVACTVSFVKVASYHGTESTGKISELIGLNEDITGRDIVIVEDIVDTGHTIEKLYAQLSAQNPASLKIASLLFKPKAYQKQIPIDYVCLEVGNEFLVGYGLDYDGQGRNLRDIYIITE